MFAVRNTLGKERDPHDLGRHASDAALREYCDRNYHQLLLIIAGKVHQEKRNKVCFEKHHNKRASPRRTKAPSESEGSACGHWKLKPKRQKSSVEDDLPQPWECEETDPFTLRICYFDFPKTRMPSHIKTYDESKDLEDHLKIFQAAAKTEHLAMPTRCHMFNSTLTGNARVWFDDLSKESMDSYDDLKKTFLENYLQQKKCIKDPVEIHNIKQRDGESTEEFVRRYKIECRDVKGAPECMKIFGFMHEITNPELIKRLHDKIPKSVGEMMKLDIRKTSRREASRINKDHNESKTDSSSSQNTKRNYGFGEKEVQASSANDNLGKKRNASKFYEFHREVGHTTDESMHLKRQIEEMLKSETMSHLIKELKQDNGKDQAKAAKKGKTSKKEKPLAILMVQPWQRVAKQKITQTFSLESVKIQMVPATTPLVGFSEEIIWSLGQISLLVKIGDEEHSTSAWMNFMIVRSPSSYNEIIGRVPHHIAEHKLNIRERCLPGRQKKRGQAPERNKAINKEVEKLVDAGIMKEVIYHSWLSNPVMVKKHDDSWRMCVDFKNFYKKCPKDGYPLPEIDWKCLVDKTFQKQIGRNLEIYVDDLVIKSRTEQEVIRDIDETFKTLREINMKLNPKKNAHLEWGRACFWGTNEC
nr:reverse transcriptase domain-containing protein [Tanacetum cinerariifolium]